MNGVVLDASALLAMLFREPGGNEVADLMGGDARISTVNVAEVLTRFVRDGLDSDALWERLRRSNLRLLPFTSSNAAAAARLAPLVQPWGLSLGDRACLVTAEAHGLPAVTADRAWASLNDIGIEIRLIR